MVELGFGIALFTAIVLLLALTVELARSRLMPSTAVTVELGPAGAVRGEAGRTLLELLNDGGIALPSACAGRGSCGLCRVTVVEGGGEVSPVEDSRLSRREIAAGVRLACQVRVQGDVHAEVPAEALAAHQHSCTLISARALTPFVKELILELPPGTKFGARPGSFVQVTAPPHALVFRDMEVPASMRTRWDQLAIWDLESSCEVPTIRAYSLANTPEELQVLALVVRLALPPPGTPEETPPGVVSSWLFSLIPGATLEVSGPYGRFFPSETERELIYIGGGVGMAPMRSHISYLLGQVGTDRRNGFWYGARSRSELFYTEEFEALAARHPNFRWQAALSEPLPEDDWSGPTGFIHDVLYEQYLADHPAPEECEYYLCGPPLMVRAVLNMLDGLGVDPRQIRFDDFGSAGPPGQGR